MVNLDNPPEPPSMYYRAPEGEDIVGKLWYTSKNLGFIGVCLGVIDAQMITERKGFLTTAGRIGYYTLPLVGMAAAFTSVTYISTNVRNKDDSWNYAFGGAVAGSIFGAWRRSAGVGALAAVALAVAGVIKKEAVDGGMEFFPRLNNPRPVHQTLGSPHFDFTITSELPGNWTTGPK